MSIHATLRSAVWATHQRIDQLFTCFDLADAAGYRKFLRIHYLLIPACEQALTASGIERLISDWPSRLRTKSLIADLCDLGEDLPAGLSVQIMHEPAALFGMVYVLEGSRLGGAVLARRVQGNPEIRCQTATRYLRHGEGMRFWPSFLVALENSPDVRDDVDAVIASALQTFRLFENAAAGLVSRPL